MGTRLIVTSTPRLTPSSHNRCDEGIADSDSLHNEETLSIVDNVNERLVN